MTNLFASRVIDPGSRIFDGSIDRIKQLFLVKWFAQKRDRASVKGLGSLTFIFVRRDKDDRYGQVGHRHLSLELESANARHAHVENQAASLWKMIRI